jgi:hypothetical protein
MRSSELAGLRLRDLLVGHADLLGRPGDGLELTLKLFQLTRSLLPGLAIGAADTCLRIAAGLAHGRRLYGRPAADLPAVREALAAAFLDLLAAEILMLSTVRGAIHLCTHELSVTSLITKIVVPTLTARALAAAGEVLGASSYLRERPAFGIFQKMSRDHAAIPIIDGSTAVCLTALATHLPLLAAGPSCTADVDPTERQERLRRRFDLKEELPPFEPTRLSLTSRGCEDVCQGLAGPMADRLIENGDDVAARLGARWRQRYARWSASPRLPVRSVAALAAAREYTVLHTAAACIHAHLVGPDGPVDRILLAALLTRILGQAEPGVPALPEEICGAVLGRLWAALDTPALLSIAPIPLAERPFSEGVEDPNL